MGLSLLKPTLYADSPQGPVLLGGACRCGHVFFPMQSFGCEKCGQHSDALAPKSLRASGKLITASLVHMHADKRRTAPFAIGTIALDDGPVIRTLLSEVALAAQWPARVQGELVAVTQEDGTSALDLRFKKEQA